MNPGQPPVRREVARESEYQVHLKGFLKPTKALFFNCGELWESDGACEKIIEFLPRGYF
jgi:hypothetical protein